MERKPWTSRIIARRKAYYIKIIAALSGAAGRGSFLKNYYAGDERPDGWRREFIIRLEICPTSLVATRSEILRFRLSSERSRSRRGRSQLSNRQPTSGSRDCSVKNYLLQTGFLGEFDEDRPSMTQVKLRPRNDAKSVHRIG